MTYVGWARVSSKGQDLENQVRRLEEYGCKKIFQGKHSGKASENKNSIDELLAYVREGDVLVVTKLDRLGRSLNQVLNIIEYLKKHDAYLIALDQPINTSDDSPMAQAMTQLLGVFAELERSFIVSRTQEGKIATGRFGGRPKKLSVSQSKEIAELHKGGASISVLAKKYDVSRMTISRRLKNC